MLRNVILGSANSDKANKYLNSQILDSMPLSITCVKPQQITTPIVAFQNTKLTYFPQVTSSNLYLPQIFLNWTEDR